MKPVLKDGYWCLDSDDSRKEKTDGLSDATKAELERFRYAPQRMTILKELQKHIRQPDSATDEPATLPFSELRSPLAPFLREPT